MKLIFSFSLCFICAFGIAQDNLKTRKFFLNPKVGSGFFLFKEKDEKSNVSGNHFIETTAKHNGYSLNAEFETGIKLQHWSIFLNSGYSFLNSTKYSREVTSDLTFGNYMDGYWNINEQYILYSMGLGCSYIFTLSKKFELVPSLVCFGWLGNYAANSTYTEPRYGFVSDIPLLNNKSNGSFNHDFKNRFGIKSNLTFNYKLKEKFSISMNLFYHYYNFKYQFDDTNPSEKYNGSFSNGGLMVGASFLF